MALLPEIVDFPRPDCRHLNDLWVPNPSSLFSGEGGDRRLPLSKTRQINAPAVGNMWDLLSEIVDLGLSEGRHLAYLWIPNLSEFIGCVSRRG